MIYDANVVSILTFILYIAIGILGYFIRNIDQRIAKLEMSQTTKFERIAMLEAHYADILGRLARIETKLDALQK